jgi:hypothetical protein
MTTTIDGRSVDLLDLHVETEQIDVTAATETHPDPRWEVTDRAGHYHAWTTDGTLPTLTETSEHQECAGGHDADFDCCEGYEVTVHHCTICGERVEPATIASTGTRRLIPGRESWTVKVTMPNPPVAPLRTGDRVSVRTEDAGTVYFGVGIPTAETIGVDWWTVTVDGCGPLGRRAVSTGD